MSNDQHGSGEISAALVDIVRRADIIMSCVRKGLVSSQSSREERHVLTPDFVAMVCDEREGPRPPEVGGSACYPSIPPNMWVDPKDLYAALLDLDTRIKNVADRFRVQYNITDR